MAQNNIKYFLNKNSDFEFGNLKLHYSFDFLSGNKVVENNTEQNLENFLYSSSVVYPSFNSISGCGRFDGETIFEIANNTGNLNFGEDFTFVFVGDGIGTIFSSYCSGSHSSDLIHSGFNFGINDAHRLFFEFKNGFGMEGRTLNHGLGNNNCLFISFSVYNQLLRLGTYDPVLGEISSESFKVNQANLFDSRHCFLGGIVNSGDGFFNRNYSGVIDEFLFFQKELDNLDIEMVNSGFAFAFGSGLSGSYIDTIEVTGYDLATGILFSGVTGYEVVETGVVVDEFGNEYSGVSTVPLTGYETGFYSVPLTGVVQVFSGSLESDDNLYPDAFYLSSFGKSKASISVVEDALSNIIEWNFIKNSGFVNLNLSFNNILSFDRISLTPISESQQNNLLFVDGKFQQSGVPLVTGSFYENGILISGGRFYLSGNKIYSTGSYLNNQYFLSDFFNFDQLYSLDGFSHLSGSGNFLFNIESGDMVFFDGKKIQSGFLENQYFVSGSSGVLSDSFDFFNGKSGFFCVIKPSGVNIQKYNGSSGYIDSVGDENFVNSLLSCYVDFYRLDANKIIEGANLDKFFNSCSRRAGGLSLIYNNDGLFFE